MTSSNNPQGSEADTQDRATSHHQLNVATESLQSVLANHAFSDDPHDITALARSLMHITLRIDRICEQLARHARGVLAPNDDPDPAGNHLTDVIYHLSFVAHALEHVCDELDCCLDEAPNNSRP